MSTLTESTCTAQRTGGSTLSDMVKLVVLGIQTFRTNMAERVKALEERGEETIVQKRGRPIGAFISMQDYREFREFKGNPTDL